MLTVSDLLSRTPAKPATVAPGDTVFKALQTMANGQVGAVIVVEAGRLVGIFTERDHARKVELASRAARSTAVREVMSADVLTVGPETELGACLALMASKRIHLLPVIDRGQVVGVIEIGDLVNRWLAEKNGEGGTRTRSTPDPEPHANGPDAQRAPEATGRRSPREPR